MAVEYLSLWLFRKGLFSRGRGVLQEG